MQSAVPGNGQPNEVRVWTRVQATCTHDARCRAGTCADLTRYARVESDGAAEAGGVPDREHHQLDLVDQAIEDHSGQSTKHEPGLVVRGIVNLNVQIRS